MRLLIACGAIYFAIDYIWSVVFVQDQDQITNAFRLNKDENGNIIHDVTKVVILYCKLCGGEGTYLRINELLETQAPELEVYGIKHQTSEGNAAFSFLCLFVLIIFMTIIMAGHKILAAMDWEIPTFLPKL